MDRIVDLPPVQLVTVAQSLHWMDRPRVATAVDLPHPQPPREVARLVRRYLGPLQRAGQGVLTAGTPGGEELVRVAAREGQRNRCGCPA